MCFVRQYMIESPYGLWYYAKKSDLKEAVRKLQIAKLPFTAYEWNEERSHYRKIGGNVYEA